MARMSKQNRMLFMTMMVTSLLYMAQFALTPGIAKIQAEVFPQLTLSAIQTAMTLPSLLSVVMSVVSALLIGKNLLSKKACVVIGLFLLASTGFAVMIVHYQFWQLCVLSVLIGSGMGFFIAPAASIMFDNFGESERRLAMGTQTSAINLGGIIMSIGGGVLATLVWYGGYLMLLVAIPVAVLCAVTIPNDKRINQAKPAHEASRKRSKIPLDIYYYGVIAFFFLLIFNVGGTNISNHLKAANLGDTATAGIATAVQMAGGVIAGIIFTKLSAKFRDLVIPLSFIIVFIGFTVINLGHLSLLANFVGIFIVGTSISILIPQCLFATSNIVDATNSTASTAIVNCVLPGTGGFLSPVIFTNLTTWLGGESTNFRYEFVGIVSLVFGIVLIFTTIYRERKEKTQPLLVQPAD